MRYCFCGHAESRHSPGMYGRGCEAASCSCPDFGEDEPLSMRKHPLNPKVISLLNTYYEDLCRTHIGRAVPIDDQCIDNAYARIGHIKWMIEKMLENDAHSWSMSKVNRWLGFIQGTLWCMNQRGILAMRDESRDLYNVSTGPAKYPDCWRPSDQ